MLDWLSVFVSPLIGAGAGSVFGKLFHKKDGAPEAPPENLAAVSRRLAQIRDWQSDVEEALRVQEKQIARLKKAFVLTRLFALISLLVIALAAAAWIYAIHRYS